MLLLISAAAFVLLLTGLILIHEYGHFFAARRLGVVVEEFGFGLPPRALMLFRRAGTMYSLNWIPFGGFVRLRGENREDEHNRSEGSFNSAGILARCVILCAGVFMNFFLAIVLFLYGFTWGRWIPTYLTLDQMLAASARGEITMELSVFIDDVIKDGGAARASVPPRSVLLAVDGVPVREPQEVIALQAGKKRVTYTLLLGPHFTDAKRLTVDVVDGKTGIALQLLPRSVAAPMRSLGAATILSLREVRVVTVQTVIGIKRLVFSLTRTGTVPEGITGIVGIARLTHESVQEGLMVYLRLVALLSLSLAILNILPFPALDGGRLIFVLAEAIRRRPANRRFELTVNTVGFTLLLLLILVVTFYDVLRLFL